MSEFHHFFFALLRHFNITSLCLVCFNRFVETRDSVAFEVNCLNVNVWCSWVVSLNPVQDAGWNNSYEPSCELLT